MGKDNRDLVIILFIKSVNKLIAVVEGTVDSLGWVMVEY